MVIWVGHHVAMSIVRNRFSWCSLSQLRTPPLKCISAIILRLTFAASWYQYSGMDYVFGCFTWIQLQTFSKPFFDEENGDKITSETNQ